MSDVFFGNNKFIGPDTVISRSGFHNNQGKIIRTLDLPNHSNYIIDIECPHGKRKVRWCARYNRCKECLREDKSYRKKISDTQKGRIITWGDKISKAKKGKKVTDKHRLALSKSHTKGKWTGFYKKGDIHSLRDSLAYYIMRDHIFKKNNWRCQITGKTGKIEMHHIISMSMDISKALDEDNLVVLSKECHKEFHIKYGKLNDIEHWLDFLECNDIKKLRSSFE